MDSSEEINDEIDNEESLSGCYYTRSKRRRLERKRGCKDLSTSGICRPSEATKRKNPIMFVPTEVLENIMRFISYHELSSKVRLVNRRFKVVAENILNLTFKRIEDKLKTLIKSVDVSLSYTQDDMEIKCITKLLNMLEILNVQHAVIIATIWRYVYNKIYKTNRTCMYGGLLLDYYRLFIWKFTHTPEQLYTPAVMREYTFPHEVNKIIQMTKTFCVHFDKVSEEPLKNSLIYSGCKIVDLLDSAKYVKKTVQFEMSTPDAFLAKYHYYFANSWFISLPIAATKDMEWTQKQRMMHMRLRRIVLAHNDMNLQQEQYERETLLRPNPRVRIKKPRNNVYTGYGDVEDTFFYYGVMNEGAYLQKFHLDEDNDEEDDEQVAAEIQMPNANADLERLNSEEDILYRMPHLGFHVCIDVKCPLSYAPLSYLRKAKFEEKPTVCHKGKTEGPTHIKMFFECYGAYYPRLPAQYEYEFKSEKN